MSEILWVGDAAVSSGFGRCTSQILKHVVPDHTVAVLGVNYHGDPHPEQKLYNIYPAQQPGSDPLGIRRLRYVLEVEQPKLVVLQTNPWNVPPYLKQIHEYSNAQVCGVIAVEGKNPGGKWLRHLDHAIFWTQFGLDEARKGGWEGSSSVIPLGVDLDEFQPGLRNPARRELGLPEDIHDGFMVLNVNRNQHRKRLDLSIIAFAQWVKEYRIEDAFLYLHAMQGSTVQLDVDGLTKYCGIPQRVVHAEPVDVYKGASHKYLQLTYQASDLGLSTSLGEGWGLTTMEGMACEIAQIATGYSAIPEWAGNAAWLVKTVSEGIMPDVYGQLGGVPSVEGIVTALHTLYTRHHERKMLASTGRMLVNEDRFRWENIGAEYLRVFEDFLG